MLTGKIEWLRDELARLKLEAEPEGPSASETTRILFNLFLNPQNSEC